MTHISNLLFLLLISLKVLAQSGMGIYIPLDGRREMRLAPRVDTLINKSEHIFKINIDPQFHFSELMCDKGLVVRVDNFLRITPNSARSGYDTLTLRVVLFGNGTRVLLAKQFIIKPELKIYPNVAQNRHEYVKVNNMTLERNMNYSASNFSEQSVFDFDTYEDAPDTAKRVIATTISFVNRELDKTFFLKGNRLTPEINALIQRLRMPTKLYVRLDVRIRKKIKSIWTQVTVEN